MVFKRRKILSGFVLLAAIALGVYLIRKCDKAEFTLTPKASFFPVDPHVILRAYHTLSSEGFHRRYILDLELESHAPSLNLSQCELRVSWAIPAVAFVDPYELARESDIWELGEALDKVDLEAPAYSPKALPFLLSARIPASFYSRTIEIPNLLLRYQLPNQEQISPLAGFPQPTFSLDCAEGPVTMIVADMGIAPIPFQVPVASPSLFYGQVTFVCILVALFFFILILVLVKVN